MICSDDRKHFRPAIGLSLEVGGQMSMTVQKNVVEIQLESSV